MDETKTCPTCKITKLKIEFYNCTKRLDGLQTACKKCQKVRQLKWNKSERGKESIQNVSKTFREHQYEKNPIEFWINQCFNLIKTRVKKKNIPFDITKDDIRKIIVKKCPVFEIDLDYSRKGKAFPNSPSVDRLIPKFGYVKNNISIISQKANIIKNNGSLEDLIKLHDWLKIKIT